MGGQFGAQTAFFARVSPGELVQNEMIVVGGISVVSIPRAYGALISVRPIACRLSHHRPRLNTRKGTRYGTTSYRLRDYRIAHLATFVPAVLIN